MKGAASDGGGFSFAARTTLMQRLGYNVHDQEAICLKRLVVGLAASVVFALALGSGALADGLFLQEDIAKALSEPEQKALIYFDDHMEHLIISPSYQGHAENFAWIVPVPTKPEVGLFPYDIFEELLRATGPMAPPDPNKSVEVWERKTIGSYEVSVLSATDSTGLMEWLKSNHYAVPEKAAKPLQEYINKGWTFVASRIANPKAENDLHAGTLAPLRFTFATNKPIYPLKLSAANPGPFKLLLYLMFPSTHSGVHAAQLYPAPKGAYRPHTIYFNTFSADENERFLPSLAKLTRENVELYEVFPDSDSLQVRPEQCIADLSWEVWVPSKPGPWW